MADNDILYSTSPYHRESIVGWPPCFPCRAFFSICAVCTYRGQTVYCSTELSLSVDKQKKQRRNDVSVHSVNCPD